MRLTAGARLGPYEIEVLVGAGGMGEVYRARDTRLDRTVAIKVLSSEAPTAERLERFRLEARAISRLGHPRICALHDVGEHNGSAFLVMEYLEGQTLAQRLEKGPLPFEQVLRFGAEIADALDRAHGEGVVHRDLKPGNIMLTRDGVKLLDFGLAKLRRTHFGATRSAATTQTRQLTEDGMLVGTVPYMAPEQVEGGDADARTDIFALGVVLFEMSTAKRPFHGDSGASLIAAILNSEPPLLTALRPLTPPHLERVVGRCLAKDADGRWQSARDLAAELRWIAEEAATAPPTVAVRNRRRPMLIGGLLVALVAAGVAGIIGGRWATRRPIPSFHRMSFRPGIVSSARFAPDGQTIVYSAAWQGRPYELFQTRKGSVEFRSLGITGARILSISRDGEMAVLLGPQTFFRSFGTLARAPLAGGVPRELLENVADADWMPDGTQLAVIASRAQVRTIEFPMGTKVYESRNDLRSLRVSPRGDQVAFIEGVFGGGDLVVVDRSGRKRTPSKGWIMASGVAWSPSADELWFSGTRADVAVALHAVSLSGAERVLARAPDAMLLQDVSRDGHLAMTRLAGRQVVHCLAPGETSERDVSWLDGSSLEALSRDGRTLVFAEDRLGGGIAGAIYVRKTDGSPAVRLGDGYPEDLSPDGKWVLARPVRDAHEWILLPTGPGPSRKLPRGPLTRLFSADFLPDGRRIVFGGSEEGRLGRIYLQDLDGGEPHPISPEGVATSGLPTPDGRFVPGRSEGQHRLYPVEGGDARPLPFLRPDDIPLQWGAADGRILYVRRGNTVPAEAERVDLDTGRREPWKILAPSDPLGVESIGTILLTPDGRSYCYDASRNSTDLFIAEGVK